MTLSPASADLRPSHRTTPPMPPEVEHTRWRGLVNVLLLVVAAGGDAVNFTAALGTVDTQTSLPLLIMSVSALTAAAVGLMHFAGVSLRKRRLAGKSGCGTSVAALTVLWLLLGLSAFALRVVVPEHAADPLADVAFGAGAAAPSSDGALQTLMLGLMMLALFCATGGMAAWGSYNGHDPARDAQRRAARARRRAAHDRRRAWRTRVLARWSRRRAVRVRERWAPVVVSLQAEAEQLENDIEREQARQASSRTACDAWIEELKEHARLRMAVALTDPAATDAVSARHLRSAPSPASARTPRGAAGVPSSTQESR